MQEPVLNDSLASISLSECPAWERARQKRGLMSFELELTARCNNNCRHCYINLPEEDAKAEEKELSFEKLKPIIDQAHTMNALWCLLTGGEPLLRKDFSAIYLYLKKKGFLVSLFTNATLITQEHIKIFKQFPPRDLEVTVYGASQETYENVTRKAGSFEAFLKGLGLLLKNKIRMRLKAVVMRSNVHEFAKIAAFCRKRTSDYFRFDPFLHLRYDRDSIKNEEIKRERLSPSEIVALECGDTPRKEILEKNCGNYLASEKLSVKHDFIFTCGAGLGKFCVTYDGFFKLCSSLQHQACMYDLKNGSVGEAFERFILKVKGFSSGNEQFLKRCRNCAITYLCMWCPATAYLETGALDNYVEYFCEVAHARAEMFERLKGALDSTKQ